MTIALLGIIFLLPVKLSSAQSSYTVILTPPDLKTFPHLTAYLDVHDQAGEFVHGLTLQDVSLLENGVQLAASRLVELYPGVQLVVAITPGSSLNIRDASGISRFEYLRQGLLAGTWTQNATGKDDLSLLTVGGPQIIHTSDPASVRSSLESYLPDDSDPAPGLEVLTSALQVVSDPTPSVGMGRAILFITPPQPADVSLGLQSIISSANQENTHVFVWLVAPKEAFDLPETDLLRGLADQTHGSFFAFSKDEPIPDLNSLIEPLRYIYQLEYDSQAAQAGDQQVAAQVIIAGESITSPPQSFTLNLQPPSVLFINPPTEIQRKFPLQSTPGTSTGSGDLLPAEARLNIGVTFPDGHTRTLVRTNLYIDDQMVSEIINPPFDQLVWDLRPYTTNGSHSMRIEATDNLGLVGQTSDISVKIIVPSATQEVVAVVSQNHWLVLGIVALISASILILALIVGGRIRPKPLPGQVKAITSRLGGGRPFSDRARRKNPVTQADKNGAALPARKQSGSWDWRRLLPWFRPQVAASSVLAYLVPLVGTDEPTLPAPLPITSAVITLGSDPQNATFVIDDPSIERLHARIRCEPGSFRIDDAGSVAGTWVNFEQVSPDGKRLKHADIIHLGRVGFRFNLPEPVSLPRIVITPVEPGR